MTDHHAGDGDQRTAGSDSLSPSSTPEGAALPTDRVREVESLVTDWLHDADVPGASVVVVDGEDELYAAGFGARDLESNAPATPDTLYGMASITKSVTALAVIQLVEDGRLAVEDPVDDYVDHFAEAPGDPITVGELLSHTSGMPATGPEFGAQWVAGLPAGVADRDDYGRWVRESTDYRVTDGDRFFYYNTGYCVLGEVIEAVDGRSYADYVGEEVLEPLGMDRSTFERGPVEADDDAMTGYESGEDAPEPSSFPFEELIHPAGGLVSSARELSRFLRATMTDGELDGTRVCSPEALDRLQRGRTVTATAVDGAETEYGYGWSRVPLGDGEAVGHNGAITVSSASMRFLDGADLGVVVACNTVPSTHPEEVGMAVLAVLTGDDPTAVRGIAVEEKCEAVTGTYETFRGRETVTVERDPGGIAVEFSGPAGEDRVTAYPTSVDPDDHEFFYCRGANRVPVEFDLGGDHDDLFVGRDRYRRTGE